jgi:hypothetical protein
MEASAAVDSPAHKIIYPYIIRALLDDGLVEAASIVATQTKSRTGLGSCIGVCICALRVRIKSIYNIFRSTCFVCPVFLCLCPFLSSEAVPAGSPSLHSLIQQGLANTAMTDDVVTQSAPEDMASTQAVYWQHPTCPVFASLVLFCCFDLASYFLCLLKYEN